MKRIQFILIYVTVSILTLTLSESYVMGAVKKSKENVNTKKCDCNFKEFSKNGDWEKAREAAEEIIKKSPKSADAGEAYLWLGLYHKSQLDFDKSKELYEKAAKLFPNTWISAEATARIGCNYYKMNNYVKSLKYFQKAAKEAKDWQQRKYAMTWVKWVNFTIGGKEQRVIANCATKTINYFLNSKGIKYDNKQLTSKLNLKDGLVPLPQIMNYLKKQDIELNAIECPIDRINELELPIVAVVKPSHLIMIKSITAEKINVYDPVLGDISYRKDELTKRWLDKILTTSVPSDKKFAAVAQKDLNKISLGSCWCCPAPPEPCPSDSDSCCFTSSSGAGGSGGSGGSVSSPIFSTSSIDSGIGGCGSCGGSGGGGGGCCVSFGFPKVSVNMSVLTLTVEDAPIGYTSPLGDVKIALTFNSDFITSGLFGNSWYSNLETKIVENTDYSVNVARTNGRIDHYTYSGWQYNSPDGSGITEKLIKNSDSTFTLEYVKSHKKYHYDTSANGGKLLGIEDKNGNTITYQYTDGKISSIIDAVGRTTQIQTINLRGTTRVSRITDPIGREAIFTYDDSNNLAEVVDMAGNHFIYGYDDCEGYNCQSYDDYSYKNITSISGPKGTYSIDYDYTTFQIWVKKIINPAGEEYQYGGGHEGYPSFVTDPEGHTTHFYADTSWPVFGDTKKIEDALGNYVEYTYGNRNRTDLRNKNGNITHYEYDTSHNIISKTDPLGYIWTYTYDARNNLIKTIAPAKTDTTNPPPNGGITEYEYDANDNLITIKNEDPCQTVLSTISYTYDTNGLITSKTDNGKQTIYEYDTSGNLIQIEEPEGNITNFGYDTIGRKTSMTNANGITAYEYDNLNRMTKIIHPDFTYVEEIYTCCDLTDVRDENGKITHYDYDEMGRRTKVTDAAGNETNYTYDGGGNLESIKDAKGNITTYAYDTVNRLTSITYPLGDSELYTYDEEGNMLTKTDGKGHTTHYIYDKDNRLFHIKY